MSGIRAAKTTQLLQTAHWEYVRKILKTSSTSSYIRCKIGVLPAGTYRVRYKAATASGYESTARIQCSFYTYQTTAAGLLKSTEWTTIEREVTLPESTSTRYLYLYAYVQGATVYVKRCRSTGGRCRYTQKHSLKNKQ